MKKLIKDLFWVSVTKIILGINWVLKKFYRV